MEFLYKLTLIPRLHNAEAWTEKDENIVASRFRALQKLAEQDIVVLAGRTIREDVSEKEDTSDFGIVIIKASTEKEAQDYMNNDPAVKQCIMKAELFPFHSALMGRKK